MSVSAQQRHPYSTMYIQCHKELLWRQGRKAQCYCQEPAKNFRSATAALAFPGNLKTQIHNSPQYFPDSSGLDAAFQSSIV